MSELNWDRSFALEQAGEDEELLAELLTLLCDSSKDDVAKIVSGAEAGDVEAMGEAAHSIKGATASLGVEGVRVVAYEIEKAGRAGDLATAKTFIAPLQALVDKLYTLK